MKCGYIGIGFSRQCVVSIVVKMDSSDAVDSSDASVGSDAVDSTDAWL
jgi:hypothetical protein